MEDLQSVWICISGAMTARISAMLTIIGTAVPERRKMSTEIIKGPFWSNCLFETLKAKIKHPFIVKVTIVPRSEANCPHFLWSDGEYDYDFGVERRLTGVQILLFRGYIRRRKLGFNKKYKERMRRSHQSREEEA